MRDIPLDLQRRFERQWAAKYASPVASAAHKSTGLKGTVNRLPRPAKGKEKPAGVNRRAVLRVAF
jgi:hypothetical protein